MRALFKEKYVVGAVAFWAILTVAALAALNAYAAKPGPPTVRSDWPAESTLSRLPGKPTLVLLLHPRCPCSEATLNELARALPGFADDAPIHVLFSLPKNAGQDWRQNDLVAQAGKIPGTTIHFDEDGIESARFGGRVSGHALLFDANGHCIFSGGLTQSRGHDGETAGRDLITRVLVDHEANVQPLRSPVFGCALYRIASSNRSPS